MFAPRNASTCLPWEMPLIVAAPELEAAYAAAAAAERARFDTSQAIYRLYWMARGKFGSIDLYDDPAFVVIGRHELCDVVLDGDPTIALRHLLLRAARLDDGAPRLSVLDLHTTIGFELDTGRRESSMVATGVVAFRVGAYAIVAIPRGERIPEELRPHRHSPNPYREPPPSRVTSLPRARELSDSIASIGPTYVLNVQSARGGISVPISTLDLETGVLVGRAPKCNDRLRNILNEGISRAHILLRRGIAYDLSSTQGTYFENRRVRSATLDDRGTTLRIGTMSPVLFHFHRA